MKNSETKEQKENTSAFQTAFNKHQIQFLMQIDKLQAHLKIKCACIANNLNRLSLMQHINSNTFHNMLLMVVTLLH